MDLSADLDGFDDDAPKFRRELDFDDLLPRVSRRAEPRCAGSLADLQAEGFNTTPPPSYITRQQLDEIYGKLFDGVGEAIEGFAGLGPALQSMNESLSFFAAQLDTHEEGETDE